MKRRTYREVQADGQEQLNRRQRKIVDRGTKAADWCALVIPELVDDNGYPCSILVSRALRLRNRGEAVNRESVIKAWKQEIERYPILREYWRRHLDDIRKP